MCGNAPLDLPLNDLERASSRPLTFQTIMVKKGVWFLYWESHRTNRFFSGGGGLLERLNSRLATDVALTDSSPTMVSLNRSQYVCSVTILLSSEAFRCASGFLCYTLSQFWVEGSLLCVSMSVSVNKISQSI